MAVRVLTLVFLLLPFLAHAGAGGQVPLQQILKRQPRTGETITPTMTVPGTLKKSNVLLFLDLVSPDLNDPAKGVKLELQSLEVVGWLTHDFAIYTGLATLPPGKTTQTMRPPGVQPDTTFYLGKQIRGIITVITCSIRARAQGDKLFCDGTETGGTVDVGVTVEIP